MAIIIDSYSESHQDWQYPLFGGSGNNTAVGQSFTCGVLATLDSCKFYLKKANSPTGNAVAKLYSYDDEWHLPDSLLATSDTIDVSTFTTSFQLIEFTFSGSEQYEMQVSTDYFIVVEYSGGDSSNNILIGLDNSSPSASGHSAFYSSSWLEGSSDAVFYVYGELIPLDININDSISIAERSPSMVGEAILDQYLTSGLDNWGMFQAGDHSFTVDAFAQGFKPSVTADISKIRLFLKKVGSPDGGVVLKIYTDSDTEPGSLLTTSNTIDNSIITDYIDGDIYCFSFPSGTSLIAETTYWIVVEGTGTISDENYYQMWIHPFDDTLYTRGHWIYHYNGEWVVLIPGDIWFEEYYYNLEVNVSDSLVVQDTPRIIPNELKVWINEIDKTKYVSQNGFQIENILTYLVDKCKFQVRKVNGSDVLDYAPTIGNDIQVTYQYEKIFGGVITRVNKYLDTTGILVYDCECEDYTKFLDRKLVAKDYTNMSVNDIISDINDIYLTDFTINNVDCDLVIDYVAFNYITVSKALAKLANLVHFDWYVDYNKDIHFFSKISNSAPFDVIDTDGSYNINTLKIKQDNSQVRNSVYVRGGEYLADTFTTELESDGVRNIYDIPYKYQDLSCTLSGQPLSVGLDYIDGEDDFDVLWNFQEKLLKWKDVDKPSATATIRVGGKPYLPVRLKTKNVASVNAMAEMEGGDGEYEFIVIDDSIKTKQGALERADSELENYKSTLIEGQFQTYKDGLRSGQKILINSPLYDINEEYLINQVTIRMWTPGKLVYNVKIVSTKTYGLIEYLQDLLLRDNDKILDIGENLVTIDVVADPSYETMAIADTITVAFNHPQYETSTLNETFTAQSLDYDVQFVLGPYTPTGTKRVFITNGSRLV